MIRGTIGLSLSGVLGHTLFLGVEDISSTSSVQNSAFTKARKDQEFA